MMTKIDLGQGTFIDLGTLIATRALVCANSGGGKSWLIRRIVEGAIATIPTIILDREGEFATLREYLSQMRTAHLVEDAPGGRLRAAETLREAAMR